MIGQDGANKIKDLYAELEKLQKNAKGKDSELCAFGQKSSANALPC